MTNSFAPAVNFLSQTTPPEVPISIFSIPGGRGSQAFMVGEDSNAYFPLYGSPTSTYVAQITCGNTGNIILLDQARYTADGGIGTIGGASGTILPANGTPYFWLMTIQGGGGLTWQYGGVLYKIINDTTVVAVNTMNYNTGGYEGEFLDEDVYVCQYFSNKVIVLTSQTGPSIPTPRVGLGTFSTVDSDPIPFGGWVIPTLFNADFFSYTSARSQGEYNTFALIPDNSTNGYHFLIYISKAAHSYMVANPGVSPTYATFTRPGVYKYQGPFGAAETITDVTDEFGLTDIGVHLDNSSSADTDDDYYGLMSFVYHNTQYVMFTRSYTQTSDLFTSGVGSYVHIQVFNWDGEVSTKVYDAHTGLFNTHSDTGGSIGGGYPPKFVLSGLVGDSIYYLWSDYNDLGYVMGKSIALTFTPDPTFAMYFSNYHDTTYNDWVSSNTVGTDFESFITSYWVMSDDSALWMEMPWVITYIDNTDTNPSCLFTPKWDWTDVDWNHHSGPTLDVYQTRSKQAVSDKRTRVRGRGRAMQLKFESSSGQPFNLLGWSVQNDRNTTP